MQALSAITFTRFTRNLYFGGKLIHSNGSTVVADRVGSVRANLGSGERFRYYPYGEEEETPTSNGGRSS